jgi:PKHD-type hydroxylase
MSHLPIWYLGKVDSDTCDQVIKELSALPLRDASMGIDGETKQHSHRNTTVTFAPFEYWFSDQLSQIAADANNVCGWQYDVDGREAIQFAQYGPDQHYGWHVDVFPLAGKATDRKITTVCLLNDPSEFEGGQFQVRLYQEYSAPLEKGSVIAFPSILEHRVTPVLSGVRYTATIWFHGPRFR